ncbi:hypothetical protein [Nocardia sp. NPDC048505]|uniref:hypothetical protein n=1 Tax=unclassified Nocardia TaxID=2637762 RepID=UPI0033F77E5D
MRILSTDVGWFNFEKAFHLRGAAEMSSFEDSLFRVDLVGSIALALPCLALRYTYGNHFQRPLREQALADTEPDLWRGRMA